ncbi:MAG: TonB family protein [Thermoanaerobaculales bacterium]|nr:TonB family protein [Thermoanaerobaculales bacterium]
MRDDRRTFRRAVGISLLLHLLLLFLVVPRMRDAWSESSAAPLFAVEPASDVARPPLEFEFVDLAEEREETPDNPNAPLSDLDRRAHGGEGEPADRPSSRGNTPQLVQSQGGDVFQSGAPPQEQGPQSQQVPPPRPEQPRQEPRPEEQTVESQQEGAGQDEQPEAVEQQQPSLPLPPPGTWMLPPSDGGIAENPDREGGRVDTGAVSFDTQWYDWGPYAKSMLAKVRRHWRIPEIARMGVEGVVKVRFYIELDGTITGVRIMDESGKPPMDFAARDAIADCLNFDPLPAGLGLNGPEGVTITFFYNVNPRRGR